MAGYELSSCAVAACPWCGGTDTGVTDTDTYSVIHSDPDGQGWSVRCLSCDHYYAVVSRITDTGIETRVRSDEESRDVLDSRGALVSVTPAPSGLFIDVSDEHESLSSFMSWSEVRFLLHATSDWFYDGSDDKLCLDIPATSGDDERFSLVLSRDEVADMSWALARLFGEFRGTCSLPEDPLGF